MHLALCLDGLGGSVNVGVVEQSLVHDGVVCALERRQALCLCMRRERVGLALPHILGNVARLVPRRVRELEAAIGSSIPLSAVPGHGPTLTSPPHLTTIASVSHTSSENEGFN